MVRWRLVAVVMGIFGGLVAAGCASVPPQESSALPTTAECVSDQGQRFLTYCASPEAAATARTHQILADGGDEAAQDLVPLPVEGAPLRGNQDGAVTIHLFSDLHCRACISVYNRLAAEVDTRPGQVRLVFRHVPGDERGQSVARAAIAAGEQGKFYEFVDHLYAEGRPGSEDDWEAAAEAAGLDEAKWQQDRRSSIIDAILESDALHAEDVDVVAGPTFFVNGKRMVGAEALTELDAVLDEETTQVEAMEEAGLAGAQISWRRILANYEPLDWAQVEAAEAELEEGLQVDYVPVGTAPTRGASAEEALVTVVIFADFMCPHSAEAAQLWSELVERHGDKGLRLAFRHFPLSVHDGSERVAAASVLAAESGQFWPFYEAQFAGEMGHEMAALAQGVRELGWDGDGFAAALESQEVQAVIDGDRQLGEEVGVEGTPTVFVNGVRLMGVWTLDEMEPLILDQIELAASIAEVTGNAGDELYLDLVEINRGWE